MGLHIESESVDSLIVTGGVRLRVNCVRLVASRDLSGGRADAASATWTW